MAVLTVSGVDFYFRLAPPSYRQRCPLLVGLTGCRIMRKPALTWIVLSQKLDLWSSLT